MTEVDDDHIREFCEAIWRGPVSHPTEVRAWHDPDRLDAERLAGQPHVLTGRAVTSPIRVGRRLGGRR